MAKQLTVLERVERIEREVSNFNGVLDNTASQARQSMASAMEVLNGVLTVLKELHPDVDLEAKISASIEAKRHERAEARVEQEKKQLEALVDAKVLKPVDKITDTCLLVTRIFNKDGEIVGLGRQQLEFRQLLENVRPAFLGQSVGFVYESEQKDRMEVLEIYDLVNEEERAAARPPRSEEPASAPHDLPAEPTPEAQ